MASHAPWGGHRRPAPTPKTPTIAQQRDPNKSFVYFPRRPYLTAVTLRVGLKSLLQQVEHQQMDREVEQITYDPDTHRLCIDWRQGGAEHG